MRRTVIEVLAAFILGALWVVLVIVWLGRQTSGAIARTVPREDGEAWQPKPYKGLTWWGPRGRC